MALVEREGPEHQPLGMDSGRKTGGSIWGKLKFIFIAFVVVGFILPIAITLLKGAGMGTIINPTNEAIQVQIDQGELLEIPAWESTEIKLKKGEHTLSLNGENVGSFTKERLDFTPLINPTKTELIVEHAYYSDGDYDSILPDNTVIFLETELEGPFEVFNDIYIKKDWDYDINEAFPEEVKMNESTPYQIKKKIFSPGEFFETYFADAYEETEGDTAPSE